MLVKYEVTDFRSGEFVYQEFVKVDEEKYMSNSLDSLELMTRALKSAINAVKNKSRYNGKDFRVNVSDIISNSKIETFNFMQVYSEG